MSKLFKEFHAADESTCKAAWCGEPGGTLFFCAFCGHDFKPGDEYRSIYTNDLKDAPLNPLTCRPCFDRHGGVDGLRREWQLINQELRTRFKFFWRRWNSLRGV